MEGFDLWKLLAGLGMFLFGMFLLEESIKNLSGKPFKRLIREYTRGKIRSVFSGIFSTALLQSSSAVSLMVLAFVGASIMSMENAIGVILGSNLGTTITAWIVAVFGFKINIESFALPMIGIGGLGMVLLNNSPKYVHLSKLVIGFGFLFMGLDYMKDGMQVFTDTFDIGSLPDYGLLFYVLIGIIVTAIMQSSSGTIALVLTLLSMKIVPFNAAAAMVIGANIGTTITILLGAIGGIELKKRVACSHLVFNLITGIVALLLMPILTLVILKIVDIEHNAVIGLALFHTLFNSIGVLLFVPFIVPFTKVLTKIFPDKKINVTLYINNATPEIAEAALSALRKESLHLLTYTMRYTLKLLGVDEKRIFPHHDYTGTPIENERISLAGMYNKLKLLQASIFTFATSIQSKELSKPESTILNGYLHAARLVLHSAKTLKDVKHNFDDFEVSDTIFLNKENEQFRKRLIETYESIDRIVQDDGSMNRTEAILKISQHLLAHDKHFLRSVTKAINGKQLEDIEVSTAIIVNRAFVQSSMQMVEAVQELFLDRQEMEVLEAVQEVGQSLND